MFLLKPSALELPRGPWIAESFGLLKLRLDLPSTEFALNKVPAVSKMLNGKSLHLIHYSLIMSEALNLFLQSTSISLCITYLASLDMVSGYLYCPLDILPYNSFSF